MGYKIFLAGEEAVDDDVNDLLMAQTVSRFANAPARAAAIAAPDLNQLTVLDDRPGVVQFWNGSGWVDTATTIPPVVFPPPSLPAGFHLQSGNVVVTTDVYGGAGINFPVAFAGLVSATVTEAGGLDAQASIFAWTSNTYLGVNIRNKDGSPIQNGLVRVMYLATGLRA